MNKKREEGKRFKYSGYKFNSNNGKGIPCEEGGKKANKADDIKEVRMQDKDEQLRKRMEMNDRGQV